jgi:hypothetical protein
VCILIKKSEYIVRDNYTNILCRGGLEDIGGNRRLPRGETTSLGLGGPCMCDNLGTIRYERHICIIVWVGKEDIAILSSQHIRCGDKVQLDDRLAQFVEQVVILEHL